MGRAGHGRAAPGPRKSRTPAGRWLQRWEEDFAAIVPVGASVREEDAVTMPSVPETTLRIGKD
jgi:hypothetical protein